MQLAFNRKLGAIYFAAFSGAILLGLGVSFGIEQNLRGENVARGIFLEGENISHFTSSRLQELLDKRARKVASTRFLLRLQDEKKELSADELGVSLDVTPAVQDALARGRAGGLLGEFSFWWRRFFSQSNLALRFKVDQNKLEQAVKPWATMTLQEPELPTLVFDNQLLIKEGCGGTVVQWKKLRDKIIAAPTLQRPLLEAVVASGKPELSANRSIDEFIVPTMDEDASIAASLVAAQRTRAERLLSGGITFLANEGEEELILEPLALGAALLAQADNEKGEFVVRLSIEKIRKSLAPLLDKVEREPVDAAFDFGRKSRVKISESRKGVTLNEGAVLSALWRASKSKERKLELPLLETEPRLTLEQAKKLKVTGLVSSFMTRHPCCRPRVKNIHQAAKRLHDVVLRPGEKFSLNEHLGPRSRASGYLAAPTIVRGKMKNMYGGGISQLATTLFNAVLRGGYEIIQRQPHSIYFSRYPEGHEATVSFPEPDLIFRNDTQAGMVIQTQFTGTYIKVLVYGDVDGRTARLKKSKRYKIVQPPKEYEGDPEMDPEESKRLRAGQLGWTLLVSRIVTLKDGTKKEESREVLYNPRPELLRVHPCMIPQGEKGHTGDDCPEPEEEPREEEEEELSDDEFYETE